MWRTFNCGIGFVLIVGQDEIALLENDLDRLGLPSWRIGEVVEESGIERVRIG
jgi:phosphoribosylformylglycinamidine cyclo-ligase